MQILHPEYYHGYKATPPFFEGWYYKNVDSDQQQTVVLIPGISLTGSAVDRHCFIQILDSKSNKTSYHRFPMETFKASRNPFYIRIDKNEFGTHHVNLAINDQERYLAGKLYYENLKPWPVHILSPGAMGWYAWVPFMECYHGILSMDHKISGQLEIDGHTIDFNSGKGYIEKDWGKSFPKAYIWLQSNHFDSPGIISLSTSIAVIPWLKGSFCGFIVGFYYLDKLYPFTTWTGAKLDLSYENNILSIRVYDKVALLEIRCQKSQSGILVGPTQAGMQKRVGESVNSSIEVRFIYKNNVRFSGKSLLAGLEIQGDMELLQNVD
jgi:hypothetical protein